MIKNMNKGEISVERIKGGKFKDSISKIDAFDPTSSPGALDCSIHRLII